MTKIDLSKPITRSVFLSMSSEDRLQFAQDRGCILLSELKLYRPAQLAAFFHAGGRLSDGQPNQPVEKIPVTSEQMANWAKLGYVRSEFNGTGRAITKAQFERLSPEQKMDFLKKENGRIEN